MLSTRNQAGLVVALVALCALATSGQAQNLEPVNTPFIGDGHPWIQ